MILTGKAKEDFGMWHFENCNPFEYINWHLLSDNLKNQIIIEWFDSVDIYIELFKLNKFIWSINNLYEESGFETRQQATEQAIIKANEIYNHERI